SSDLTVVRLAGLVGRGPGGVLGLPAVLAGPEAVLDAVAAGVVVTVGSYRAARADLGSLIEPARAVELTRTELEDVRRLPLARGAVQLRQVDQLELQATTARHQKGLSLSTSAVPHSLNCGAGAWGAGAAGGGVTAEASNGFGRGDCGAGAAWGAATGSGAGMAFCTGAAAGRALPAPNGSAAAVGSAAASGRVWLFIAWASEIFLNSSMSARETRPPPFHFFTASRSTPISAAISSLVRRPPFFSAGAGAACASAPCWSHGVGATPNGLSAGGGATAGVAASPSTSTAPGAGTPVVAPEGAAPCGVWGT